MRAVEAEGRGARARGRLPACLSSTGQEGRCLRNHGQEGTMARRRRASVLKVWVSSWREAGLRRMSQEAKNNPRPAKAQVRTP